MIGAWTFNYAMGMTNLLSGNIKNAYQYGCTCRHIIASNFKSSPSRVKPSLVENYYKTVILLKSCSDYQKCNKCAEKQLLTGFDSLCNLKNSFPEDRNLTDSTYKYLNLLNKDLLAFYTKNKMNYELNIFRNKYRKEIIRIIN